MHKGQNMDHIHVQIEDALKEGSRKYVPNEKERNRKRKKDCFVVSSKLTH